MRIKLVFESNAKCCKQHKICFFLDKDSCKTISDLSYLIQKRFFSCDGVGTVCLYLSGEFYFPPQETIDVINENDTLTVRFNPKKTLPTKHDGVTAKRKKRKISEAIQISSSQDSESSSCSSSSEEEEEENKIAKKSVWPTAAASKNKNIKVDNEKFAPKTTTAGSNNNRPLINNPKSSNIKRTIPISKLGVVTSAKAKKQDTSSSSSSASSSESSSTESESESDRQPTGEKKKPITKKPVNATKKPVNDVKKPGNDVKKLGNDVKKLGNDVKKLGNDVKKPGNDVKKLGNVAMKQKSEKSKSSDSSSSTSDEKGDTSQNTTKSKIDFNVSKLSTNATSTPGSSSVIPQEFRIDTSMKNESLVVTDEKKKNNFAWQVAVRDVYKNVSEVVTNTNQLNSSTLNTSTSMNDTRNSKTSFSSANVSLPSPSGKTLRNRRRRQKRLETQRYDRQHAIKQSMDNGVVNAVDGNSNKMQPPVAIANGIHAEAKHSKFQTDELPAAVVVDQMKTRKNTYNVSVEEEEVPNGRTSTTCNKDYSKFPVIQERPDISSVVAFKLLEMDETYQPQISDYQEAKIKSYNVENGLLELQLCEGFKKNKSITKGKFDLDDDVSDDSKSEEDCDVICKQWKELLEARLIGFNPSSNDWA